MSLLFNQILMTLGSWLIIEAISIQINCMETNTHDNLTMIRKSVVWATMKNRLFGKTVSRRRAASIMLHIFGMRVYGYQQGSSDRMRQALREGLLWLPWE